MAVISFIIQALDVNVTKLFSFIADEGAKTQSGDHAFPQEID
jgi:hypothetical protein